MQKGDHIKEDKIGGNVGGKKCIKHFSRKRERDHGGNISVDGISTGGWVSTKIGFQVTESDDVDWIQLAHD
jgi:hypothetical protein